MLANDCAKPVGSRVKSLRQPPMPTPPPVVHTFVVVSCSRLASMRGRQGFSTYGWRPVKGLQQRPCKIHQLLCIPSSAHFQSLPHTHTHPPSPPALFPPFCSLSSSLPFFSKPQHICTLLHLSVVYRQLAMGPEIWNNKIYFLIRENISLIVEKASLPLTDSYMIFL